MLVESLTLLIAGLAMAAGIWLGLKLVGRMNLGSRPPTTYLGRVLISVLMIGIAVIVLLISNRGQDLEYTTVIIVLAAAVIATYAALRRPKGK